MFILLRGVFAVRLRRALQCRSVPIEMSESISESPSTQTSLPKNISHGSKGTHSLYKTPLPSKLPTLDASSPTCPPQSCPTSSPRHAYSLRELTQGLVWTHKIRVAGYKPTTPSPIKCLQSARDTTTSTTQSRSLCTASSPVSSGGIRRLPSSPAKLHGIDARTSLLEAYGMSEVFELLMCGVPCIPAPRTALVLNSCCLDRSARATATINAPLRVVAFGHIHLNEQCTRLVLRHGSSHASSSLMLQQIGRVQYRTDMAVTVTGLAQQAWLSANLPATGVASGPMNLRLPALTVHMSGQHVDMAVMSTEARNALVAGIEKLLMYKHMMPKLRMEIAEARTGRS